MKRDYIKYLVMHKNTQCFIDFYKFFDHLLNDARLRNDTALPEEVQKIQGEIRLLKKLLNNLNPSLKERTHYDGAYGSI